MLLSLLASCSFLMEPSRRAGELHVQVAGSNLLLTNRGGEPIHHLAFEANFAALALWAPCASPSQAECPPLNPGETRALALAGISGYAQGRGQDVIVYWWHLVGDGPARWRVDNLQSVKVRVP
jgi:hypothetical protein